MKDRASRVEELFLWARKIPDPEDRRRMLARECQGDRELEEEVQSLLDHDVCDGASELGIGDFLDGPETVQPTRIGSYEILGILGEGGMGIVYEAQQERPHRIVALKVLRAGALTPKLQRRFRFEAETLASLQHPHIAQIHEAGVDPTDHGMRSYFAMERVHGRALTEYSSDQGLSIRQRLELFLKVCEGVHYAHQKGVIHRDLKPGNLLVESGGTPKILDFGIARSTESDLRATLDRTASQQILGTPAYMSPEQAAGQVRDIDIRSDIYSLGVVLYELLAGELPYDLRDQEPLQALQVIRDKEPLRLGTFHPTFRGDLETIVHKALEKDKTRRYPSLAGLADDILAFLDYRPIAARPPSTWYRLQKFCRRNRATAVAVVSIFLTLLVGFVVSTTLLLKNERLLNKNRDQLAQNQLMIELYEDLWTSPDPSRGFEHDVTVREVLDQTAGEALQRLTNYPEVQARFERSLAATYHSLGSFPQAEVHGRKALHLYQQTLGSSDETALLAEGELALTLQKLGKHDEAKETMERVRRESEAVLGPNHRDTLLAGIRLAAFLQSQSHSLEALELLNKVVPAQRRTLGDDHPEALEGRNDLAVVLAALNRFEEAMSIFEDVVRIREQTRGPQHPLTLKARHNLGSHLMVAGFHQRAREILENVLTVRTRVLGEEHSDTLETARALAYTLQSEEKHEQALPILERIAEVEARTLGEGHPHTLLTHNNLGQTLVFLGRVEEGTRLLQRVFETHKREFGPDHDRTLVFCRNFAIILAMQEKYDAAVPLLLHVLEVREKAVGKNHAFTIKNREEYLRYQSVLEVQLREQISTLRQNPNHEVRPLVVLLDTLGWSLFQARSQKPEEDTLTRADDLLTEAMELATVHLQESDSLRGTVTLHSALCRMEFGEYFEARELVLDAYDILLVLPETESETIDQVLLALAQCSTELGEEDEALRYQALLRGEAVAAE